MGSLFSCDYQDPHASKMFSCDCINNTSNNKEKTITNDNKSTNRETNRNSNIIDLQEK